MNYIEEQDSRPLFKVKVVEKGYDDIIITGATPKGKCHLRDVIALTGSGLGSVMQLKS